MQSSFNYSADKQFQIAAFYCFTPLLEEVIKNLQGELTTTAKNYQLMGTILLAKEGINGTICGPSSGVNILLELLGSVLSGIDLEVKFSWSKQQAFERFKARLKNEIVTMGVPDVNPLIRVGEYIEPCQWNSFIDDEKTLLIDTRNDYEVAIGSFRGALNPNIRCFRDFPIWVKKSLIPILEKKKPKRIAMFCTGGIRCEKATSFLKQKGIEDVHHLHGGILRYLEEVPNSDTRWEGECFVFDKRVALNHALQPGVHSLCYACGLPLSPKERESPDYIVGVQCGNCVKLFSDEDRKRFAERQRQKESSTLRRNSL